MGLDPSTAHIGYNWDNDKISAPVHELVTAADWADCLQSGIGQTERARVRMVSCIIKNLNLPEETAVVAKPSKKRKERASSVERKTYDFTKEYKELRSQLSCAKHRDQLCYVHPDGHHVRVEPAHVSLWAKEISFGKVTKLRPPENIMFQDYFLPERKRARTSKPESPKNPTIHVTVNTGSSGAVSPLARSPLAPITAATANAANMKHPPVASQSHTRPDHSDFENIYYPPVTDILQSIDDSKLFEDSVALPFPAVVFADDLHSFQITRVDQVTLLEPQFFVDQVNMPRELAEHFVDESITAMERTAAKGKGRALF
ncbi:hypothetical protein B0H11DRAFT_1116410 [Mycena galericulata]|nr:hypothetical protein B0H11DRAFT_1116410 [Mycena galericulata]